MEYLFVLTLIARNPLYLFSPQCYQPATIQELVTERMQYINEVIKYEDLYGEYSTCIKRSDDDKRIDYSLCDHGLLSFAGHHDRLEDIERSGTRAEYMSIRLGNKIERLMRKKLRA